MKISFTIPEEPFWHEGIYRLETSDPVLGWDPELVKDGPANRQWTELAERTLYLRDLLNKEHLFGEHKFSDFDLAEDAKIPESKLALDYATLKIEGMLNDVLKGIDEQYDRMQKYSDIDLSSASILSRLVPYVREYFKGGCDFELFTDSVSLRTFLQTPILREIAGDDSLDVFSTKGIQPGASYFIIDADGSRAEEVTVLSVLSDTRIRFTHDLEITRDSGYLSSSNVVLVDDSAIIKSSFTYITDYLDIIANEPGTTGPIVEGRIYVHRENVNVEGRVWYRESDDTPWQRAEYAGKKPFIDGSIDDVFIVPAKRLKLRIEYPGAESPWKISYIAVKAIQNFVLPEQVRHPEIIGITRNDRNITIFGESFASLWELKQKKIEACVSSKNEYGVEHYHAEAAAADRIALTIPYNLMLHEPLVAKIRYIDEEGVASRWSDSFAIV